MSLLKYIENTFENLIAIFIFIVIPGGGLLLTNLDNLLGALIPLWVGGTIVINSFLDMEGYDSLFEIESFGRMKSEFTIALAIGAAVTFAFLFELNTLAWSLLVLGILLAGYSIFISIFDVIDIPDNTTGVEENVQ